MIIRDSIRKYVQQTIRAMIMINLLISCTGENGLDASFDKTEMRIVTTIRMGFSDHSDGITRSTTGETEDDNYSEGTEIETAEDRRVTSIRVFAFLGDKAELNQKYEATVSGSNIKPFTVEGENYLMDMELPPALYEFVLIVNEEEGWGLDAVTTRTELNSKEELLNHINPIREATSTQLTTIGIPMTGNASIQVPSGPSSPGDGRWVAQPAIELVRTIAKVQAYLTNIDPITEEVFPGALGLQISSVSLTNVNQRYNVYNSGAITESETVETITGNAITHTAGAPFVNQMILEAYMAERFSPAGDPEKATCLEIVVNNNDENVTYSIPIYQTNNELITGVKNYNIFRNHLYRLNCTLVGTDMEIEIYYNIGDWSVEERSLFLGMGYQLELIDGVLTVANTMPACDPHKITMKPLSGTTLTKDGNTFTEAYPAIFDELPKDATASYVVDYSSAPTGNVYLEVYYNDILVKSYMK